MAFQFSLQSLLDFRRSVEHQQELRLQATNQQVAAARRIINQLDDRIRQSKASFSEDLALGTTSAELRFALAVHTSLYRYRQDLERELLRGRVCVTSSSGYFSRLDGNGKRLKTCAINN